MSNLVRFPDPRQIKEEASLWLVCLEEGLSNDERKRLAQWLEADPAHGQALVRMARVWDSFDVLAELAEIFPLDRYGHVRHARWASLRVAAVALVAVGLAALGTYALMEGAFRLDLGAAGRAAFPNLTADDASGPVSGNGTDIVSRAYQTAVGEQLSARLPDGSVITLNTDTLLKVEYSAAERLVVLERGEAIFSVARNQNRPFLVRAGERIVQAVGTVFNVKLTRQDEIEVTVTEGRVRIMRPTSTQTAGEAPGASSAELTLVAGSLAIIRALGEEDVRPIEPAQIEANLAWQHGVLIYSGETLAAVLEDVSRYTTVRFVIADDSLRDRRVGGYFRTGDIDSLLLALRESFGIEQHREGDMIILTAGR